MIIIIISVMLISGFLGGLINSFLSEDNDLPWWKHVIVGIGASFMVPLFLNMLSSGLISELLETNDYTKLFVLAGFSLVAAVSSRAFIRTLTEKILKDVKKANSNALEAKRQASTALDILDEDESKNENIERIISYADISDSEQLIITEMTGGKYTMRSIAGLAKSTGLELDEMNQAITSLMQQELVEQGLNSKGNLRWYASPLGRAIAKKS